jgi:hypothetical protein
MRAKRLRVTGLVGRVGGGLGCRALTHQRGVDSVRFDCVDDDDKYHRLSVIVGTPRDELSKT